MSGWEKSQDGQYRTDIRVAHRMSVIELARALAIRMDGIDDRDPQSLSNPAVMRMVREELTSNGQHTLDTWEADEAVTNAHVLAVVRAFKVPNALIQQALKENP